MKSMAKFCCEWVICQQPERSCFCLARENPNTRRQSVFISRDIKAGRHNFSSTFPRKARLIVLSTYPKTVEHDLRQLGFPNNLSLFPGAIVHRHVDVDKSWLGVLPRIVMVLFVLVLFVMLFLGYMKLKELFRYW